VSVRFCLFFRLHPPRHCEKRTKSRAERQRSREATRSALDDVRTMGRGGGCGGLCLSAAPRPLCGVTQGRSPRQEDVGRRRGRPAHAAGRAPRRDGPDGSAGEGQGTERFLRAIAAAFRGEAGARETDGVRCRTAERGGRVVRAAERSRRQFVRRKLPHELP